MKMVRIALMSLALAGATFPAAAFASHQPEIVNVKLGSWETVGDVAFTDGNVVLHADKGERAHVWQDVDVRGMTGRYVAFAAYTKAEEVRSGISGRPVLYAMALDSKGKVLEYFQQEEMTNNAAAGKWDVSSGVFQIPSKATTLRVVLKQATKRGVALRGADATFRTPVVTVVDSKSKAESLTKLFGLGLPRS